MNSKQQIYKRILKKYKKTIMKKAEAACENPFDAFPGLDMFIEHLKFQRDYYKNGYKVMAMERVQEDPVLYKNMPTRAESLDMAISAFNTWQHNSAANREEIIKAKYKFFSLLCTYFEEWWD